MNQYRWLLSYIALCLCFCAAIDVLYLPVGLSLPDEQRFLTSAGHLLATGQFRVGADRAWEMPLTAGFYAAVIRLAGDATSAVLPIRLLQALLLALQVWLSNSMARMLFDNRRAGLAAAAMIAVYPSFIFYQGLLLSETLFSTLLLAGMAALVRWRSGGAQDARWLLAAMFTLAAATWVKASLTVLPPLLAVATAAGASRHGLLRTAVLAMLSYALVLSPWWVRNALVLDAFVPFTTSSGQNLYLGNNPYNSTGGNDWATDVNQAEAARLLAIPDERARQGAFVAEAAAFVAAEPATALRLAGLKFLRFWNIIPNAVSVRSPLIVLASALSFGPVLLLSVVSVMVNRRHRWMNLLPILLLISYFTILHTVTIASLRYRLPIEPLLIVLASHPLALLLDKIGFLRRLKGGYLG